MKNGLYELVVAPIEYPGKRYRNRYCYEHHLVWWKSTGELQKESEIIHHKDGNKRNNSFDNLEIMNKKEHTSYHVKNRGRKFVKLICPTCKNEFIRAIKSTCLSKGTNVTFCSRKCSGKFNHAKNKTVNLQKSAYIISVYREYG